LHLLQADSAWRKCNGGYGKLGAVEQAGAVTDLLHAWSRGDADAVAELAAFVQHELRQTARRLLAGERLGCEWQPTELINESYVRLLGWSGVDWRNRAHFFSAAASMMRRVLVDVARTRNAAKRGAGNAPLSLDRLDVAAPHAGLDVAALGDAIEDLAAIHPRPAQVVEMRFFGGFSVEETADTLGVSARTVINDWNTARAWLFHHLSGPAILAR
jgi:RNA polymerase sigma factor (TIGR02999 family)